MINRNLIYSYKFSVTKVTYFSLKIIKFPRDYKLFERLINVGIQNHPQYAKTLARQFGVSEVDKIQDVYDMLEYVPQKDVHYLCFEGGGGKGIILLWAVKELERRAILKYEGSKLKVGDQIKGLAGSSAGALMAVMLSIGFRHKELEALVGPQGSYNLNRFLDLPYRPARRPSVHKGYVKAPLKLRKFFRYVYKVWGIKGSKNDDVKRKIKWNFPRYASNLFQHMGIFAGYEPIRFFNKHIAERAALVEGQSVPSHNYMTFKRHKEVFGVDLVITGSNFSTGKSELFSADTTPNWPVCVAAGNSMRLPIIYKPTVVSQKHAVRYTVNNGHERNLKASRAQGVWVDGGYFNNLPMFAFAHLDGAIKQTLGVSISGLNYNKSNRIKNLWSFLAAYAELGFFGAGEAHVSATTGVEPNRINLMAGYKKKNGEIVEIGLTDFKPHPDLVKRLNNKAQISVSEYFDQ